MDPLGRIRSSVPADGRGIHAARPQVAEPVPYTLEPPRQRRPKLAPVAGVGGSTNPREVSSTTGRDGDRIYLPVRRRAMGYHPEPDRVGVDRLHGCAHGLYHPASPRDRFSGVCD